MGYDIYTYIGLGHCSETDQNLVVKWIQDNKEDLDWCIHESLKWYTIREDVLKISQQFPNLIFSFLYAGDDENDNTYFLVHNGVASPDCKIDMSSVENLQKLIREKQDHLENQPQIKCEHLIETDMNQITSSVPKRKKALKLCEECRKKMEQMADQESDLSEELYLLRLHGIENFIKQINMTDISPHFN